MSAVPFSLTTMSLPPVARFVRTVRARTSSKQISHAGIDSQLCLTPCEYFRGVLLSVVAASLGMTSGHACNTVHAVTWTSDDFGARHHMPPSVLQGRRTGCQADSLVSRWIPDNRATLCVRLPPPPNPQLPCLAPTSTQHARTPHRSTNLGVPFACFTRHCCNTGKCPVRADERIRLVVTSMRRFDFAACHRRNTSNLRRRSFAAFSGLAVPARTPILLSHPPQRCPSVMPPFPDARHSTPLPASGPAPTAVLHR